MIRARPIIAASTLRVWSRRSRMAGEILIQSMAILEYLDELHPEPPFLPKQPTDRARIRALADIVACDIHPINNLRVLRYLMRELGHDEAAIAKWYNHWIAAGFRLSSRCSRRMPGPARSARGHHPVWRKSPLFHR